MKWLIIAIIVIIHFREERESKIETERERALAGGN